MPHAVSLRVRHPAPSVDTLKADKERLCLSVPAQWNACPVEFRSVYPVKRKACLTGADLFRRIPQGGAYSTGVGLWLNVG